MLIVADRIDAIYDWLKAEGLESQFHPSYTRMVPAHHVVELQLIGCPDPDPVYTRFFTPEIGDLPSLTLDRIGELILRRWRTRFRSGWTEFQSTSRSASVFLEVSIAAASS